MRAFSVAVVLAVFPCSMIQATTCEVGSLQSYIDLGVAGCEIEDKTVLGFFDLGVLGGATAILPAEILVTPLATPGNPGLTFDFGVAAAAGDLLESLFAFSVAVLPGGQPIEAVSLSLSGSDVVEDGVNTALLCLGTTDPACPTPDPILLFDIGVDSLLADMRAFPPVTALDLVSDIVVDGGLSGSASLMSATILFHETTGVPEPTLSLPVALLALGLIHRRSQRTRKELGK